MRAKSLVERILAFSRSGMGERVPVHVQSVVDGDAGSQLAASLPTDSHAASGELDAGDAAVLGDPTQVHQVVMNLCANAVQAMRSRGTLDRDAATCATAERTALRHAACCADGAYVRLSVRGHRHRHRAAGARAHLRSVLHHQGSRRRHRDSGLSLVHGIVTDLGGGIDVESRLGEGATFTVYLPWQQHRAGARAGASELVTGGSGETVLLVDDEEALVRLGEEMIAGLGYEPVGFTSSTAALETFRATPQRFDAVLSDEAMPDMTGSELAREIRAIRRRHPDRADERLRDAGAGAPRARRRCARRAGQAAGGA